METALEHILINSYKTGMIAWMDTHPENFEEAVELAIADKQTYSCRAASLIWSCMEENDPRIVGHIENIINTLTTKDDSHQRELLKILLKMEIIEEYEGFLFSLCVSVWENVNKTPSVRFTAFKVIIKIAEKHSELLHEITFLTQERYLEFVSPAVRKSISRMKKKLTQ